MNKKTTIFCGIALVACSLLTPQALKAQTTYYVMHEAAGTGDGSSWENASADIQAMINAAVADDNIFVGFGIYHPNRKANDLTTITLNDRDNAFVLKEGVKVYGGFAGTETSPAERSLAIPEYQTTLSGDFNNDDIINGQGATLAFENNTENAYHVVIAVGTEEAPITAETVLDGFTISGGNASNANAGNLSINGQNVGRFTGGGIALYNYASPSLKWLSISHNTAAYGGGLYCRNFSTPSITNSIISYNYGASGGGVCNWTDGSPVLNTVTLNNNVAIAGGGMYNYENAAPVLTEVLINENVTTQGAGGGMYNYYASPVINESFISDNTAVTYGGGICSWSHSQMVINGGTINGNTAETGGGLYINDESAPFIDGTSVIDNTATANGGGIYVNSASTGTYKNFTVAGNTANIGGGILCYGTAPFFANGIITGNNADAHSGGLGNFEGANPVYTNCVIAQNTATLGAGMYNINSSPIFTNITLTANTAVESAGGMAGLDAFPVFRNSIIYGNTAPSGPNVYNLESTAPTYYYTLIQGIEGISPENWWVYGVDGGNNFDADPLFTDAQGGDFTLTGPSPAFNAGNNTYFEAGQVPDLSDITTDAAGNDRIYSGTNVDLGAYEIQETTGLKNFNGANLVCYPNPVTDMFTVESKTPVEGIAIYNTTGQLVISKSGEGNRTSISLKGLAAGIYQVQVNSTGSSTSSTIIKQ